MKSKLIGLIVLVAVLATISNPKEVVSSDCIPTTLDCQAGGELCSILYNPDSTIRRAYLGATRSHDATWHGIYQICLGAPNPDLGMAD